MDSHSAAGGAAVGLMTWWRLLCSVPVLLERRRTFC